MKESLEKRVKRFGLGRITTTCGQSAVEVEKMWQSKNWVRVLFKTDHCGGCSQVISGHKQWMWAGSRSSDCPYWDSDIPKPYGKVNIDGNEVEIYKVEEKLKNWLASIFIRF